MRQLLFLIFIGFLLSKAFATVVAPVDGQDFSSAIYLWLALSIAMSRGFTIVNKIGLPIITAEILAGMLLGNLDAFGINIFYHMYDNEIIKFMAELGAMILMFEIGLETRLSEITSKIGSGLKLALIGTILTFAGGYLATHLIYPEATNISCILVGLICAATATGISGKVFKDMKILNTIEVKTVLTASLIDEIISILCFAILSGVFITGKVNLNEFILATTKTALFLLLSISIGGRLMPLLVKWAVKIHAGISMKIGILFLICTFYSWLASVLGLPSVIGAFIAGIIINPEYFKNFSQSKVLRDLKHIATNTTDIHTRELIHKTVIHQEEKSLDELIKPLSNIFVPIFFTYIGLIFDYSALNNLHVLIFSFILILTSLFGRFITGFSEKGNLNKYVIGLGITPIGEAGLIFTIIGRDLKLLNEDMVASIILALIIISILSPILLKLAIKKKSLRLTYHKL